MKPLSTHKTKIVRLSRGRKLLAAYSLSEKKTEKWVVFLTESGADFEYGRRRELIKLMGARLSKEYNYLVVNKPGLYPRKRNDSEFERSFRRARRVNDARQTMRTLIPSHHSILLVGYSEGAYLAPEVALKDSRIQSVIMIGGGTRGWLKEEINNAPKLHLKQVVQDIRWIRKRPRSLRHWNGFSCATWNSYHADRTAWALNKIKVPVLAIVGARDKVIDLKAAKEDLRRLSKRKPVRLKIFASCGHSFSGHWPMVRQTIVQFLELNLPADTKN